mmetsp:Transcript_17706/g.43328  ORF Transcript_17706/g.43328 Transcript_17706/m.43328 type:complete len:360 (+) Transcript_17706:292-1371(+)
MRPTDESMPMLVPRSAVGKLSVETTSRAFHVSTDTPLNRQKAAPSSHGVLLMYPSRAATAVSSELQIRRPLRDILSIRRIEKRFPGRFEDAAISADWYTHSWGAVGSKQRLTWRALKSVGIHMISPYHPNPIPAVTPHSSHVSLPCFPVVSSRTCSIDERLSLSPYATPCKSFNSSPRGSPSSPVSLSAAAVASRMRPTRRRKRGLSPTKKRQRHALAKAGMEQSAMKGRQPSVGITAHAINATAMLPIIQKAATTEMAAPRRRAGTISDARLKTTGTAPPTPQPVRKRSTVITRTPLETEKVSVKTKLRAMDARSTGRRPCVSARRPATTAPTSIPRKTPPLSMPLSAVGMSWSSGST